MTRVSSALLSVVVVAVGFPSGAARALARWRPVGVDVSSIAYNQGVAFDDARREFFFDGVSSATNSGVYRTDAHLRGEAANTTVIPKTTEGYNHAGDLSFDPVKKRILLPLECYYPQSGGNTCGVGAVGIVDPMTLRFRYYVNLARGQIKKAMWDEIDPDGRWIWTSSGTHLLAYRAADITAATARRQRAGKLAGIVGVDLGSVLPTGAVTGAAFYRTGRARTAQLLLSLNLGDTFEVVSTGIGTTRTGRPKLVSHPATIITVRRSALNDEPEGIATTPERRGSYPLGGLLHWQMLPTITSSSVFSRVLTYMPLIACSRHFRFTQASSGKRRAES
jgi:hypothetical protein